ncbi:helix-turn-helix domain-containing protein [Neorhizobium galegae]|uniref:helix-turn-helix domain-containing protein n=1 Tax=Neorhizobium galegae TaxID=399 RepID=UPI0021064B09|nr:helix-turn-helix domain-containing protein [Neorhizobium galegae]MCQ1775349.1 helix-turn-helix domain-containing protein [Neorhizobium galegae]MCQ1799895.1 helix-turn-helix domain-containing protein [Neorhizobium galegae]
MSDEKKESRFLKKWKLVRAAARDKARLSMGDVAVLMALCDRYGSKYDPDAPALAGHALLGAMSGLSRRATIDSTRRLVDAGYITVLELGSGTRGTRYGLNFASGEDVITTKPDSTSGEAEFTTVVNPSAPLDPLSGEACFTESPPTESRLQADLHVVGNKFEAAPLAPPVVGLTATTADTASGGGDGFSEFWSVWPRKHGIKKARAEWEKILTDVDIVIEVAGDWAAHYEEHGIDKRWIPEPANWLKGERWKEDLPIVHIDAKGAAIAKAKANAPAKKPEPANDNVEGNGDDIPEFMKGSPSLWPVGEYWGEFVDNRIDNDCGDHSAWMTFLINTPGTHFGNELQHRFYLDCCIERYKNEGTQYLADICRAVGLSQVEDLDELMFKPLRVKADGNRLLYTKVAEAA